MTPLVLYQGRYWRVLDTSVVHTEVILGDPPILAETYLLLVPVVNSGGPGNACQWVSADQVGGSPQMTMDPLPPPPVIEHG